MWNIIADSSSDLLEKQLSEDVNLSIVPLTLNINGKAHLDNETLDISAMMAEMKASHEPSSSACPSPGDFAERFMQSMNNLCVCMTSALSGTYNSALIAMKQVKETHADNNIFVIDSRGTGGMMQLIVNEMQRLINEGLNFEEIAERAEKYARSLRLIFSLASFDNLIKAGRMSKSAGLIASILGIRAIAIATEEGKIEVIDKPRGVDRALKRIVDHMMRIKDITAMPIIISHCNNPEAAERLKAMLLAASKPLSVTIAETRGVCSYYADQQGLLISF